MGFEPEKSVAAPCDWPGCAASADPSVSLAHSSPESLVSSVKGAMVRAIGLDVHRDFCEVAIAEQGNVRSAGRIATRPEVLELFAQSLASDDRVVLEVTGNAWEIARIIEPRVARVIVVSPGDTGIRHASWSAVRNPGPLHAFYQRIRARRGHQIAITAAARTLACLFWVLLLAPRGLRLRPALADRQKLRRLEITAGAPRWQDRRGIWIAHRLLGDAELDVARQAEQAYAQTVRD